MKIGCECIIDERDSFKNSAYAEYAKLRLQNEKNRFVHGHSLSIRKEFLKKMKEYKCVECNHWDMADCFEIRGNEPICSDCWESKKMKNDFDKKPIDKKTKKSYTNK